MKYKRATVCFGYISFKALGECGCGEICIDLKTDTNPLKTYLHEQIYLTDPGLPEELVLELEARKWERMTQKERFNLGKKLFNRKFRKREE